MTFRLLFDERHFRSISLEKYMAVFCVDFAANCTIGTTNMSIQYTTLAPRRAVYTPRRAVYIFIHDAI